MHDIEKLKEEFELEFGYEPTYAQLQLYYNNKKYPKPPEPMTPLNYISGYLFILWFLASIISLLYASSTGNQLSIFLAGGQYFPIFFLYIALAETKFNILAPISGFIILYFSFNTELISSGFGEINVEALFPLALGFSFFIAGLFAKRFGKDFGKKRKVNYIHVFGKVSAYDENSEGLTACIYEYQFKGEKHNTLLPVYTNFNIPNIGDVKDIMVNPNNPNDIYIERKIPGINFLPWIFIISGFLVMFFGFCFLFK